MAYLIAKKNGEQGCLAVEVESGKAIASLVTYLGLRTLEKGISISLVSDMDTFYENKPYKLLESEKELIISVLDFDVENPLSGDNEDEWDILRWIAMESLVRLEDAAVPSKKESGNVCKAWAEQKADGRKQGFTEGKEFVAVNLMNVLSAEKIHEVTALSMERIEELRKSVCDLNRQEE